MSNNLRKHLGDFELIALVANADYQSIIPLIPGDGFIDGSVVLVKGVRWVVYTHHEIAWIDDKTKERLL